MHSAFISTFPFTDFRWRCPVLSSVALVARLLFITCVQNNTCTLHELTAIYSSSSLVWVSPPHKKSKLAWCLTRTLFWLKIYCSVPIFFFLCFEIQVVVVLRFTRQPPSKIGSSVFIATARRRWPYNSPLLVTYILVLLMVRVASLCSDQWWGRSSRQQAPLFDNQYSSTKIFLATQDAQLSGEDTQSNETRRAWRVIHCCAKRFTVTKFQTKS